MLRRDQNYRRGKTNNNKTKTEPNLAWASGANLGLLTGINAQSHPNRRQISSKYLLYALDNCP